MHPQDTTSDSPKLCECGCGQPAPIAKRTNADKGHVAGQPVRFILGHHNKVRPRRSISERFWQKVVERGPDDCWEWTGCKDTHGYGFLWDGARAERAYRISWELHNGPIPNGLHVLHKCDNPPCVNPAHLFLGTNADNMADKDKKGRGTKPPIHHVPGDKSTLARFTNAEAKAIRRRYAEGGISLRSLASLHGMSLAGMWKLVNGISYPNA